MVLVVNEATIVAIIVVPVMYSKWSLFESRPGLSIYRSMVAKTRIKTITRTWRRLAKTTLNRGISFQGCIQRYQYQGSGMAPFVWIPPPNSRVLCRQCCTVMDSCSNISIGFLVFCRWGSEGWKIWPRSIETVSFMKAIKIHPKEPKGLSLARWIASLTWFSRLELAALAWAVVSKLESGWASKSKEVSHVVEGLNN